jgi:hypothetical protein
MKLIHFGSLCLFAFASVQGLKQQKAQELAQKRQLHPHPIQCPASESGYQVITLEILEPDCDH